MKFMRSYAWLILPIALFGAGAVFMVQGAGAQTATPQLLINWQADTYAPAGYAGKVLPAGSSRMVASVDLFDQGRRVNLSTSQVSWYLNDVFHQGGIGLTRLSFSVPNLLGSSSVRLRAHIPDHGGGVGRTIVIPVVAPDVVIGSSAPSLAASAAPFVLQAYPYFWNVQDALELQFAWSGDGLVSVSQNPFTVTGEMASAGRPVRIELTVANPSRPVERTVRRLTIFPEQ